MIVVLLLLALAAAVAVCWRLAAEEGAAEIAGVQVVSRPLSRGEDRRAGSWKATAWAGDARFTAYGHTREAAEKKARRQLGSLLAARARTERR